MVKRSKYVWAIAQINKDHIMRAQHDLDKHYDLSKVEAFIPTVRVLSKRYKSHPVYENVPIMMNYGFFKVTRKQIKDYAFMNKIKAATTCISGWLKNPANAPKSKLKKNVDEAIPIAFTEKDFIDYLTNLQLANDVYSPFELQKVAPGQIVTLKCYPFENMEAKIILINMEKKKVRVELVDAVGTGFSTGKLDLDFEHVFFTIYKSETDPDAMSKAVYIEDLKLQNKNHKTLKDEDSEN
jgi:transcription antitermination factor NusG